MQVDNFLEYVDQPKEISSISTDEILPIIKEFPYCQTGQLMYAINLNSNNSILFEEQLKKTASICPDRTKLFELINQTIENSPHNEAGEDSPSQEKEGAKNEIVHEKETILVDEKFVPTEGKDELGVLEKEYLTAAISSSILLESDDVSSEVSSSEKVKEINLFDENKEHDFSSWLKHYSGEEVVEEQKVSERERNQDIINKFIQEDPKIEPKKTEFYSPTNMARLSVTDSGAVSETLALIYVDQGNYQEAINAYKKLSLKNPKKSSYFAAQIKILKQKLK